MDAASKFLTQAEKNVDIGFKSIVVLPGDDITKHVTKFQRSIKIGAGLTSTEQTVIGTSAGTLRYRAPTTYWVECGKRRYIPKVGDQVVGVVEERGGEFYRVNILGATFALLNRLAFEGATKRNKPELKRGDVIYARVSFAHKDLDTELTCISSSGSKKEWSSGETVSVIHFCGLGPYAASSEACCKTGI
jgi:exosome complex component RRP40